MNKTKLIQLNSILSVLFFVLLNCRVTLVHAKDVNAELSWFNITELSFRVNGIVSDLDVMVGDYLKTDQKIINLDQREYLDNVLLTKSLLKSRNSELHESKRELERAIELFDRTVLSEHELQIIKNNFISSETNSITANKNWLKAKRELEFSNLKSPFNAVVLNVLINENETVVSSFKRTPAIVIAEANRMSANFMLNATEINNIKKNDTVEVIINGSSYKGSLFFPSLIATKKMYPVSVKIDIPFGTYKAGLDVLVKMK